ncbi:hypothetical protein VIAG107301_02465 [Vibrio agarivorans]
MIIEFQTKPYHSIYCYENVSNVWDFEDAFAGLIVSNKKNARTESSVWFKLVSIVRKSNELRPQSLVMSPVCAE